MINAKQRNTAKYSDSFEKLIHFVQQEQLLRPDLWQRFAQQFKTEADNDGGWRGEYWGKMMRGGCLVYAYSQDKELYSVLTDTIEDMLTAEDDLGRISSYGIDHEFDAWDIWCRKYVLLGMQHYLEICRDEELSAKILASMCRQVDYIMSKLGRNRDGKKRITQATRHWRGLNSSSILEPIMKLYGLTKEQRYLDFAAYIVDCGGMDIVNVFDLAHQDQLYPYQYPVTKAYEMISCFESLLEYYYVTGEEKYKESVIRFANKILESDFTIIGCSGCTNEYFDHSTVRQASANKDEPRMQETCVAVTLMRFFYKLFLLTGESRYADAFETSYYNAYLGAFNTEMVIEPTLLRDHPDWAIEALPFDSYSPLTAGTRGNGIGGVKLMSDNHYYGCCACIGAAGLGMFPRMALVNKENSIYINLFSEGVVTTKTPAGNELSVKTETRYPVGGSVKFLLELAEPEESEIHIRIPAWSKDNSLRVNGENTEIRSENGYVCLRRLWQPGAVIELELDMRTECLKPISYGHQVLMNKPVWGANYMIPTYDEEDPLAKYRRALRRGPIVLAQENRLGYNVDEPADLVVGEDGFVDANFPDQEVAPYPHLLEVAVPLADGNWMHLTDYASAGKLWTEESKMAAWILTQQEV